MSSNRGVAYVGPGKVEVQSIPFPELVAPNGKKAEHGVILKVVSTNICGSDQHMVRGRTTAPTGLVLGHEITGEVIEVGRDVETLKMGDIVSVPFNVACGRCRTCKEQAHRRVPDRQPVTRRRRLRLRRHGRLDRRPGRVRDGALRRLQPAEVPGSRPGHGEDPRPDLPVRYPADRLSRRGHGGVGPGSTVYVAGAGPVGLAAAASARLLGAAVVIVGDVNPVRLAHAQAVGFETVDLSHGHAAG